MRSLSTLASALSALGLGDQPADRPSRHRPKLSSIDNAPLIITTWHREAFLLPLLGRAATPVDVMVSRAGDGEIISRTL